MGDTTTWIWEEVPCATKKDGILQVCEVVPLLQKLDELYHRDHAICGSHAECPEEQPFCYEGSCTTCDECHFCHDGIDDTCGSCRAPIQDPYNTCGANVTTTVDEGH